jgi:hypothetical protein
MPPKKYLIAVIDDGSVIDGPDVMPAIDAFNEKLRVEGQFVFAWGLHTPEASKVIDNRAGLGSISQGSLIPHEVGSEYISGIWIIEAESPDQAEALAAEGSKACNRKVELRPFH